jgi:hypothetical protein
MMIDKGNGEFHFYGSEEPSNGPDSVLDGIRTSYHYDEHGKEWVVRLYHPKGMQSVCGCPSEIEAKLVASSIAAVVATADCTFTITTRGEAKVEEVEIQNLVEFDSMRDSMNAAADAILDFIA